MLLEHVKDLMRAAEFATKVDEAPVWSELGHAQLATGHVADAIASYLKAGDSSAYVGVTEAAKGAGCYPELVTYLTMVRK